MSILPPSDLQLVKSQPQQQQLYLCLYQPETIFAARCTTSGKNSRIINYSNVSTGTSSAVFANALMLVGTTPAGNDLGAIRVRSVSGSYITVAENSNINWVSGAYLTVLNYVDIEAIYPRMIQDPNNQNNVIFYKDYDIPYTNQNSVLGTFVCMGPHRSAFRDRASGLAQLYWSSSGTYNVQGHAVSYNWFFEGATVTGSSLQDPGWVTYNQAGYYRTTLSVTDNVNGAVDVSHRFVCIQDNLDTGPIRPLVEWEIHDLNGSRKQGGFNGKVRIWENVDNLHIRDGGLVILLSDDYYGTTQKNLGGNAENNAQVFWVGYILKGSIIYDYKEGAVEFSVGSVTEMMKQAQGFSVSCQSDKAPDTWFKILDMTNQKAVYHYLKWHSTVLSCTDYQYTKDDRSVQYFDSSRESLYDSIAKFIETGLEGEVVSDRQGKIWAEISVAATNNARNAFPVNMQIYNTDWGSNPKTNSVAMSSKASVVSNSPIVTERFFPEYSYIERGGIAYSGPETGTFAALMACAPGSAPAYKGQVDTREGLILIDQNQLNQLVGNIYAYYNSQFPEFAFPMVGAYKNMDIAPIEIVQMNLQASQTPRGITLVNEPFHVTQQEWRYYARQKAIVHTVHLAQLMNGVAGDTITIPITPATNGFNVPGLQIPPLPALTIPPYLGGLVSGTVASMLSGTSLGAMSFIALHNGTSPQLIPQDAAQHAILWPYSFQSADGNFSVNNGIVTVNNQGTYLAISVHIMYLSGAVVSPTGGNEFSGIYKTGFTGNSIGATNSALISSTTPTGNNESVGMALLNGNGTIYLGVYNNYTPTTPGTDMYVLANMLILKLG